MALWYADSSTSAFPLRRFACCATSLRQSLRTYEGKDWLRPRKQSRSPALLKLHSYAHPASAPDSAMSIMASSNVSSHRLASVSCLLVNVDGREERSCRTIALSTPGSGGRMGRAIPRVPVFEGGTWRSFHPEPSTGARARLISRQLDPA